jgi:sugar (pentulose or hexulose) kinase
VSAAEFLVGLDVGTTGSKAVVFDLDGRSVAVGRAPTPWRGSVGLATGSDSPGEAELDAHELLDAALTAVSHALAAAPSGRVVGLGVTSMAESGVLLDARGEPVAPVIAWHDARDVDQVSRLGGAFGAEAFSVRTGLPLRPQWSLTKHRWQLDHDPASAAAVRRLNVAEWIVRGLGGDEASDSSLASRTGWLDLASRSWWTESLDWSGAFASLLPPLVTSGTPLGRVQASAGLRGLAGAVLTTAGHDHQAATVGAHAAGPGDQLDSCGTAEALVRTVPAGLPARGVSRLTQAGITVGWHVLDDRWALLGATEGGLALQRVLSVFGGSREALAQLDAAAMESTPGAVTVEVDDATRVTVGGIGDGVTAGQVWRAALEEITDQIHKIDRSMTSVVGPHRRLVVTGGWSRSPALMHVKQRVLGDLALFGVEEAGARGAAFLAGLAAGTYAGVADFPGPGHQGGAPRSPGGRRPVRQRPKDDDADEPEQH